ncbi:Trans-enoyl reductase ACTTS2 [Paramyrothecium foliicola]|nr:Trans-enoyl reductase ACTTS2 [Paramyrothecium foliicola]
MRALITAENQNVEVKDVAVPKAEAGEILVKVHYVAQNPTDWKAATFTPPGRPIGCDFAGTVAESNGSQWQEGQRVAGFVYGTSASPPRGAFAEYLVTEASLVFPIPDSVSFESAATVPLAFATAVQVLFQRLQLPEPVAPASTRTSVLINGGASSVGMYAVQLSKLAGLFVVATGSKKNHELLKSLGADATIDYNDSDWIDQIRSVTEGNLKYAFDAISEEYTTPVIARALAPGGRIVCILPRKQEEIDASLNVKVESTIVYTVFERPVPFGGMFDNCGGPTPQDKAFWEKYLKLVPEWLSSGKIKPNPVKELGGLDSIPEGFKTMQEGRVRAEKLVYKIA